MELKQVFSDLVQGFGSNHARIYYALLSSEVKTANQLIQETSINQATTYSVLRNLIEWELISCSNTNPANYFLIEPLKTFEKQIKKLEREIDLKRKKLELVLSGDADETQRFLIKIGKGNQTKLVNVTTKHELKYREELEEIKQTVEGLIKAAPEREKITATSYF